jgi:cytochrome c biogenesis protein CcmG/thiol:disulfide interchange protein DsbE
MAPSPASARDSETGNGAAPLPPWLRAWMLASGLTVRTLMTLALTLLATGALLVVLLVRLIGATQTAGSVPSYPLLGHPAPDFTVTLWNGSNGQKVHLAELKGKPVVLNFWASWCDPCRDETPLLEQAYQKYASRGVVVVGLAYNDTLDHGKPFVEQYGVTYPVGPDPDGATAVAYGVAGVPETVFIGRDGNIAGRVPGGVSSDTLESHLQAILA